MSKCALLGAAVCAVALVVACGSDESSGKPATGGAGGSGGSTGGSGGNTGGSAGSGGNTGGSAGSTGGSAGTGGAAGSGGDAAVSLGRLLVAGTDFSTTTEIASVDLDAHSVLGSVSVSDGDAVPAASGGLGFVLERTNSKIDLIAANGSIDKTIDVGKAALGDSGTGATNPVSVVAIGGSSNKAYAIFGGSNHVAVLDLASASVTKTLDLAPYVSSGDADGVVDALGGVLDPTTHRIYFLLGRVDVTTVAPPNYQLACPSANALLMAIDTATDTLVDLNGTAAGEGVDLVLANPVDLAIDTTQNRLFVLSAGCFEAGDGGATRVKHGVEVAPLTSLATSTAYSPTNQDYLARFLLLSSSDAILDAFDPGYAEHWYAWTTSAATLGSEKSNVPMAPSVEDAGHLLGVNIVAGDGGANVDVVRYDVSGESVQSIISQPWTGSFSAAAGTALVK